MTLGKRKRTSTHRRSTRRRFRVKYPLMRSRRSRFSRTHAFKRRFFAGTAQLSNVSDTLGVYTFKLTDLPNYTEFVNLFDQYRINKVAVAFEPQWTGNDINPQTTLSTMPDIRTILDYTDSSPPASFNEMYEYDKCKITRGNRVHRRYFSPAVLCSNYETVTTSAYTPKWKQWLTTDDPATPHYCLKFGIDKLPTGSAQNLYVRVYMTYYIECKNVK